MDVTERLSLLIKGVLCTDSRGSFDAVEVNESPLLGLEQFASGLASIPAWKWAILFDLTFTSAKRNKSVGKSALDRLTIVQVDEGSLTEEECLLVQQFQHELQFTHALISVRHVLSIVVYRSLILRGPFSGSNPRPAMAAVGAVATKGC